MERTLCQLICENHFTLSAGRSPVDLTMQLLPMLGSTDPVLRDHLTPAERAMVAAGMALLSKAMKAAQANGIDPQPK